MKKILSLLVLMALVPLAFAQNECKESCCDASGGTWNANYNYCEGADASYYNCTTYCENIYDGNTYNTYGGNNPCCGSLFILGGIVGAVVFLKTKTLSI